MYPESDEEFRKAIELMGKCLPAPPGKYRVCMWDNWELSSSGYTFEEAMSPYFAGDFDDPEEAIRIATWRTIHGRRRSPDGEDYQVYDEKGRYLGGNPFLDRDVREARIEAYRRWLKEKGAVIRTDDAWLFTERLKNAFLEACHLHGDQVRKGTKIPYVSHLMAVASLVMENGGNENEVAAALLHDAAEDHGGREALRRIRDRFGCDVEEIVAGCTDTLEDPKPPWKPRKEEYLERLRKASPSVKLVAAADKLHNARAMLADYRVVGEELWKRFNASKADLLWYHREVTEVLRAGGPAPLVEDLDRVVTELEQLASACPKSTEAGK